MTIEQMLGKMNAAAVKSGKPAQKKQHAQPNHKK